MITFLISVIAKWEYCTRIIPLRSYYLFDVLCVSFNEPIANFALEMGSFP